LAVDVADIHDGDLDTSRAHVLDYVRDLARRELLHRRPARPVGGRGSPRYTPGAEGDG
jgi:hypothetical protein